jgi:hypothetical protein
MYGRGIHGAGYPRVVGHGHPQQAYAYDAYGQPVPVQGYVAGGYVAGGAYYPGLGVYGQPAAAPPPMLALPPGHPGAQAIAVHPPAAPAVHSPPWRPMMAPGSPPLGEHHVTLPLTPETFNGTWGGAAGAPVGTVIIFSARPQKPFKLTRLIVRGTKSGPTAIGNMIGQQFVGTSLQQGELGFVDLESIGAATAFDTWVSFHQAEPGVWIRIQSTLTAFPTPPDFEVYTISAMGHYLQ